tara:strand:+ start:228 stop:455 length:228 start_codon:yes stop_codon:yes gene_type:complete
MEYALVLLICSSVAGNCLPPISYDDRYTDAYSCMINGYQKSLNTTKDLGPDEVNLHGIYIKFGCTKIKIEKGIST